MKCIKLWICIDQSAATNLGSCCAKDIEDFEFQDHGGGYSECYEAYNDCHSDYYDAE